MLYKTRKAAMRALREKQMDHIGRCKALFDAGRDDLLKRIGDGEILIGEAEHIARTEAAEKAKDENT